MREEFKDLTNGEPLVIITTTDNRDFLSTGNEYEGLTPAALGECSINGEPVTVQSVECVFADRDHTIPINDDFDGTLEAPALSIVANELIGTRPATRPHK